jgi:hypothetical protein
MRDTALAIRRKVKLKKLHAVQNGDTQARDTPANNDVLAHYRRMRGGRAAPLTAC